jgi:hypothetical protein
MEEQLPELAKAGKSSLRPDRLEIGNVSRHHAGISFVGRKKVLAAKDLILEKNPHATLEVHSIMADDDHRSRLSSLIEGTDLTICATDNRQSKLLINELCVHAKGGYLQHSAELMDRFFVFMNLLAIIALCNEKNEDIIYRNMEAIQMSSAPIEQDFQGFLVPIVQWFEISLTRINHVRSQLVCIRSRFCSVGIRDNRSDGY